MGVSATGYYRLADSVALRSWSRVPYAYYTRDKELARGLSRAEFELLMRCDGTQKLDESELLDSLVQRGLAESCACGEAPLPWSRFRAYENAYVPKINFMITGRCNYNCLHCFNAADNAPLMSEWSYDDACGLIAQARDCGIRAWQLTGGEPMVHPRFLGIVREIYRNNMMVFAINTNGHYVTAELLDELRAMGCRPIMKISFDGVGYHDWMRQRTGAEGRALEAMRLCAERGFPVMAQVNLNRRNRASMDETLDVLEGVGVRRTRVIRTSEAPRWEQAAGDACLTFSEYYDECLAVARRYARCEHRMELDFWQFLTLLPVTKEYLLGAVKDCGSRGFRYTMQRCAGNRTMMAITSRGDVVPCMQMSGYFEAHHIRFANVHETPLAQVLTKSPYLDLVRKDLYGLCADNEKCAACPHFRRCAGGCPALGVILTGGARGFDSEDLAKCLFFEGNWEQEIAVALDGWTNLSQ